MRSWRGRAPPAYPLIQAIRRQPPARGAIQKRLGIAGAPDALFGVLQLGATIILHQPQMAAAERACEIQAMPFTVTLPVQRGMPSLVGGAQGQPSPDLPGGYGF